MRNSIRNQLISHFNKLGYKYTEKQLAEKFKKRFYHYINTPEQWTSTTIPYKEGDLYKLYIAVPNLYCNNSITSTGLKTYSSQYTTNSISTNFSTPFSPVKYNISRYEREVKDILLRTCTTFIDNNKMIIKSTPSDAVTKKKFCGKTILYTYNKYGITIFYDKCKTLNLYKDNFEELINFYYDFESNLESYFKSPNDEIGDN